MLSVIKMSSKCHQNVIRIITNSAVGLSGAELSCGSVSVWEINYSGWLGGWVAGWLEQLELRLTQLPTKLKLKLKLSLAINYICIYMSIKNTFPGGWVAGLLENKANSAFN